jgi:3-oxoacyl-[acyl-carrier protein] reductase
MSVAKLRLKGKVALVTGGSRGIGAAIARAFAREGARVIVNYRSSEAEAGNVVKSITSSGGDAISIQADVAQPADVARMFDAISKRFHRLDILMNCAGVADPTIWNAKLSEITPDMWQRVLGVDVVGGFLCDQRAAPLMKKGGSMINISSTPVLVGDDQGLVYTCAKAAVLTKTKMLARILAPNIRVNCMILGSIETGWVDWLSPETLKSYTGSISLKRFGKPEEVASVAVFFASDESSYITGESIVVDGGDVMD